MCSARLVTASSGINRVLHFFFLPDLHTTTGSSSFATPPRAATPRPVSHLGALARGATPPRRVAARAGRWFEATSRRTRQSQRGCRLRLRPDKKDRNKNKNKKGNIRGGGDGRVHYIYFYLFAYFFRPIYYPRTTLALPLTSNSDLGSHSGSSSPRLHYGTFLHFYRENNSAFSSLVDSRRIVRTHAARRSQHSILFL